MIQSRKAERIREIWASGRGIACHQIYNNIAAPEAFCREAAIIDAIGMCLTVICHVMPPL